MHDWNTREHTPLLLHANTAFKGEIVTTMAIRLKIISTLSISFLITTTILFNTKPHEHSSDSIPTHHASSHHLLSATDIKDNTAHPLNPITTLIAGTWDDVHIVFTTGCNGYQNWQSEVLFYSWARIKHPGRITRIIAGMSLSSTTPLKSITFHLTSKVVKTIKKKC